MPPQRSDGVTRKLPPANPWPMRGPWAQLATERACAIDRQVDCAESMLRGLVTGTALSAVLWLGALSPILF